MRIVCKVGTRLVTEKDHSISEVFLKKLAEELSSLIKKGHEICIVTSGAVGAGRSALRPTREKKTIPYRQALAALGQAILIERYRNVFAPYNIPVAQALITNADFSNRSNFLNTKRVFELLMKEGIIPVVNENDVTTNEELTFGDNDMLSAKTAVMISADLLLLLTGVSGLFTDDPKKNPSAKPIPYVSEITRNLLEMAKGSSDKDSIGGMNSKVMAAKYAVSSGVAVFIGNGTQIGICDEALKAYKEKTPMGNGTFFEPVISRVQGFKKWLKPKILKGAKISVDARAGHMLREEGKSLLAVGITAVSGNFSRGDVVTVFDPDNTMLGYGQVNYSKDELFKILGKKTSEISGILGYAFEDEAIHRDNMVMEAT